jgi:hypothetical protein
MGELARYQHSYKGHIANTQYMAESIPLRSALRIQRPIIVETDFWKHLFDLVLEFLSAKHRFFGEVERQTVKT